MLENGEDRSSFNLNADYASVLQSARRSPDYASALQSARISPDHASALQSDRTSPDYASALQSARISSDYASALHHTTAHCTTPVHCRVLEEVYEINKAFSFLP